MPEIFSRAGMRIIDYPLESLCDAFFFFYALWTLVWIAAYFADVPFHVLSPIFILLLPLSLIPLGFKPAAVGREMTARRRGGRRDLLLALSFTVFAVILTLFLHRPDADDEKFLGMALSLVAGADQAVQSLPGYGAGIYAITAYEPLKAMVSYTTGLPLVDSYYLLVPALMSALTVIVTYRLLRALVAHGWVIGMLFFFVVMLAWGDAHRTQANFGFVRMFQGKSVVVSLVVPAILFYYLQFRSSAASGYSAVVLICALICGIGLSRAGFAIGPLLVLSLGLASMRVNSLSRSMKPMLFTGILSAAVVIPFVYQFGWNFNPNQLIHTADGVVDSTTNLDMYKFTMGDGVRGVFLLACVALSFLFVENKELRYPYRNYLALCFLLLLIPWTSNFFAKAVHPFLSWRWMWILPVPVLASVAIGGAIGRLQRATNRSIAFGVFLAAAIGFSLAAPRRVVSKENYATVRWPQAKLWGETIYLRPQESTAVIKNGLLHLRGQEKGY